MTDRTPIAPAFDGAAFRMIDVGAKRVTRRAALAVGWISMSEEAFVKLRDGTLSKGDALALAEIAGISGAKAAAQTIPLCHPLPLDRVGVVFRLDETERRAYAYCQAVAHARTGVEMEALAGVNAALLTVWDLCKATDPALEIGGVRLLEKSGGKSGRWITPYDAPDWLATETPAPLTGRRIAVVVLSDRASTGVCKDISGPLLKELAEAAGAEVEGPIVIPDDPDTLSGTLRSLVGEDAPHAILTSGGTGLGPRDRTPDVVASLCDRMAPGIGELLRQDGANFVASAWLSRSVAGMIGGTLVVTLPGSPRAVKQGWEALLSLLPHALDMIAGGGH